MDHHDGIAHRYEPGDGPPVVFIHGWLGSHHDWDRVLEALHTDQAVLVYDQRCHGDSQCRPYDLDGLVADLGALIDQYGLHFPVLAGHSMGGTVALRYAAGKPVAGLLLAGSFATTPEPRHRSPAAFLRLLEEMDRGQWAAEIAANYSPSDSAARDRAEQELRAADETAVQSGLELMIDLDLRDEIDAIDAPATVISGTADAAITPEKGKEIAAALDCPHHHIEASHLMLQERPEQLATELAALLGRTGSCR